MTLICSANAFVAAATSSDSVSFRVKKVGLSPNRTDDIINKKKCWGPSRFFHPHGKMSATQCM
jgi:hypothetical protein